MGEGITRRSFREKQYQEREEFILQVAEKFLLEKGYHDMSMDEIAEHVGIAKGTLYRHFAGKEDLVSTLFTRNMSEFLHTLDGIIAAKTTAHDKMESALRACLSFLGQRFSLLYSPSSSEGIAQMLAGKKEKLHAIGKAIADRMHGILEEGKKNGEFDATLPTEVMLAASFSIIAAVGYKHHQVFERHLTEEELFTCLIRMYLKSIATPC